MFFWRLWLKYCSFTEGLGRREEMIALGRKPVLTVIKGCPLWVRLPAPCPPPPLPPRAPTRPPPLQSPGKLVTVFFRATRLRPFQPDQMRAFCSFITTWLLLTKDQLPPSWDEVYRSLAMWKHFQLDLKKMLFRLFIWKYRFPPLSKSWVFLWKFS